MKEFEEQVMLGVEIEFEKWYVKEGNRMIENCNAGIIRASVKEAYIAGAKRMRESYANILPDLISSSIKAGIKIGCDSREGK